MPKLIYTSLTTFNADWMRPLVEEYFHLEQYDPTATYGKDCIFFRKRFNKSNKADNIIEDKIKSNNGLVIFDNLAEQPVFSKNNIYYSNPNWFWYSESLWWKHLGYDQYCPAHNYKFLGLLLSKNPHFHRVQLIKQLGTTLDTCLWSNQSTGKTINGDVSTTQPEYQRYFNPLWYNRTCFSIVSETAVSPLEEGNNIPFITEKTFKPISFYHPFIIQGQQGTLKYLHSLGFETFENIFDESYDNQQDFRLRTNMVVEQIKNFNHAAYKKHSKETLKKLKHNHDHFYRDDIPNRIKKEIIEPLLNFL